MLAPAARLWLPVKKQSTAYADSRHGPSVVTATVHSWLMSCAMGITATVVHQRGHGYKSRALDLYHDEIVAWLGVVCGGEDAPRPLKANEVSPDKDRW